MTFLPFLQTEQPDDSSPLFGVFAILFIIWLLVKMFQFIRSLHRDRQNELAAPHPITAQPDCLVYTGKNLAFTLAEMDTMLMKHFPYYRELDPALKKKFLRRLHIFIRQKIFIIRHSEGFKEMPVLLSAAAIQITFGLSHFRLPFFRYIQIHPEEYFADDSFRVLAGHVYGSTITVAWNHFYKNYQLADGVNVGLHEMAHAVYFQHMVADVFKKSRFVAHFKEVMDESEEVYNGSRQAIGRLFTKNAFKDLQEFWAESLEIFFEKPLQMQLLYPNLFERLCNLLQQNPIITDLPISNTRQFEWPSLEDFETTFFTPRH